MPLHGNQKDQLVVQLCCPVIARLCIHVGHTALGVQLCKMSGARLCAWTRQEQQMAQPDSSHVAHMTQCSGRNACMAAAGRGQGSNAPRGPSRGRSGRSWMGLSLPWGRGSCASSPGSWAACSSVRGRLAVQAAPVRPHTTEGLRAVTLSSSYGGIAQRTSLHGPDIKSCTLLKL